MTRKQITVVTDGMVELATEYIEKYGIIIVPRQVKIGKKSLKSDRHTTLRDINKGIRTSKASADFPEPPLQIFLDLYQELHARQRGAISVHLSENIDGACHQARVAQGMLPPDVDVLVFESYVLDLGTSFLVRKAARFAGKQGATTQQALALLQRAQDAIQVLLITGSPRNLPGSPSLKGEQRIKASIPFTRTLLSLDNSRGTFKVEDQGNDPLKLLSGKHHLLRNMDRPRDVLIKCRRREKYIGQFQSLLSRQLGNIMNSFNVVRAGIETSYLPADAIEIVFLPTDAEIERIERSVIKWGR